MKSAGKTRFDYDHSKSSIGVAKGLLRIPCLAGRFDMIESLVLFKLERGKRGASITWLFSFL